MWLWLFSLTAPPQCQQLSDYCIRAGASPGDYTGPWCAAWYKWTVTEIAVDKKLKKQLCKQSSCTEIVHQYIKWNIVGKYYYLHIKAKGLNVGEMRGKKYLGDKKVGNNGKEEMEVLELWNRLVTLKVDLTFRSVSLCVTLGRVSLRCSASPSTNGANKHSAWLLLWHAFL